MDSYFDGLKSKLTPKMSKLEAQEEGPGALSAVAWYLQPSTINTTLCILNSRLKLSTLSHKP